MASSWKVEPRFPVLIWKIAFRNLFLHKLKTVITGLIIVLGTTLAIVGNALVDAISTGMQRSLTNSVTGDIQIYAADAKEKIAVLGSMDGNVPDIGHLPDFQKVKLALLSLGNVKEVVPMGTNTAMLNPGNLLDVKLEALRKMYRDHTGTPEEIAAQKEHLQAIVRDIDHGMRENPEAAAVFGSDQAFKDAPASIAKALDPAFWRDFDAHYADRIEFLANKLAPLILDDTMLFLSYIGTVPSEYEKSFSQFEIVKGEKIPDGKRGFLFSDYIYETQVKNRVARRLDQIKKQVVKEKLKIADTKALQDHVTANVAQAAEIYTQMEPPRLRELVPKLQKLLGSAETDVRALIKSYLDMNDANFPERYKFFYDEIAPHVVLYKVKVGDTFSVTAYTKTGYASSVNLKVYGTYRFKSFENSPIAGNFNILDLVSFRDLFGFMTADKRAETQDLEKEMGLKDAGKDDIEAMFGGGSVIDATKAEGSLKGALPATFGKAEIRRKAFEATYSAPEMEGGVFLNAAVILKDPSKLSRTITEINELSKRDQLGIQAVDWREAAGAFGHMTLLVRVVLYFFVLVIFGVATFIIMNSMLMATLERAREIGTMRAIGAQRRFLLSLFLHEAFALSFVFGLLGTLLGSAIVTAISVKGIPSQGDVSSFFFSGDRLYLSLNPLHIFAVFMCMTIVAVISTLYPAWRAMRISPLEAMQKSD
jgi:ABC-type lipoprotein release transport system permease subunit